MRDLEPRPFLKSIAAIDPPNAAVTQARNPIANYRKIDDYTIEIGTPRPISYFPNMVTWRLRQSDAVQEGRLVGGIRQGAGRSGPFKIVELKPRVSATLVRNDDYWDKTRIPKLDKIVVFPMYRRPPAVGAALRPGRLIGRRPMRCEPQIRRVPDRRQQLPAPGRTFNLAREDSPFRDIRVRHDQLLRQP